MDNNQNYNQGYDNQYGYNPQGYDNQPPQQNYNQQYVAPQQDYNNQQYATPQQDYNNQQYAAPQQDYTQQNNSVPQGNVAPAPAKAEEPGKVLGIISLVSGILSITCCIGMTSLIPLILGIVSKSKQKENNGLALAGIILGAIGLVIFVVYIVVCIIIGVAAGSSTAYDAMSSSSFYY